jgi:hypothetical protein
MINENVFKVILGILLIGLGAKVIIVKKFVGRGGFFDFSSPFLHWPIGILCILIGFALIYTLFKKNV